MKDLFLVSNMTTLIGFAGLSTIVIFIIRKILKKTDSSLNKRTLNLLFVSFMLIIIIAFDGCGLNNNTNEINENTVKSDEVKFSDYSNPVILPNIKFGNNSDKLFSSSDSTLNEIYHKLNKENNLEILLVVHTDSVGSETYNLRLSEKRALSIKSYLINKGLSEKRIKTLGLGSKNPISTNETNEGRALNRRTEIYYKNGN